MPKEEAYDKIASQIVNHVDDTFDKELRDNVNLANSKYEPFWKAKNELAKNTVSLASGALVLTVTFSKLIFENASTLGGSETFLFLSWGALLISIGEGFLSLNVGLNVKKSLWEFYYNHMKNSNPVELKNEIKEAIKETVSEDEVENISGEKSGEIIAKATPLLIKMLNPGIEKLDLEGKNWQLIHLRISFTSFIIALIFLGILGWMEFAG